MRDEVRTISVDGKTIVRITENGAVSERKFDHEDFAKSWADGQRVRLEQTVANAQNLVRGLTGH